MKCLILTNYEVTDEECSYIRDTDVYKIALNQHGQQYKPDVRFISDYVAEYICQHFPEPILSVRDRWNLSDRVKPIDIEFKGATIIAAIDYAKLKGYDNILLVADNTVHSKEFQQLVKDNIVDDGTVYQCSNGNFNLPVKSIKKWILS